MPFYLYQTISQTTGSKLRNCCFFAFLQETVHKMFFAQQVPRKLKLQECKCCVGLNLPIPYIPEKCKYSPNARYQP